MDFLLTGPESGLLARAIEKPETQTVGRGLPRDALLNQKLCQRLISSMLTMLRKFLSCENCVLKL